MALIDWEAVCHDLEAFIEEKDGNSFGQRELVDQLLVLRVKHRQVEGLPEKALRLYSEDLVDALSRGPNTDGAARAGGNGQTLATSQGS